MDYYTNATCTEIIWQTNNPVIEFSTVPGWDPPTNSTIRVVFGVKNHIYPACTRVAQPAVSPAHGLSSSVPAGDYAIVTSTDLLKPLANWTNVQSVTISNGQTVFTNTPPADTPFYYYRAKQL